MTTTGRNRVVIEGIKPQIDGGRFPIKRVVGERVEVQADLFADGHDQLSAVLMYRPLDAADWQEVEMAALVNDRWEAAFPVDRVTTYEYAVRGWVDRFRSWRRDLKKRLAAGQNVRVDQLVGAELIGEVLNEARSAGSSAAAAPDHAADIELLARWQQRLSDEQAAGPMAAVCDDLDLDRAMFRWLPRRFATTSEPELRVVVDRKRAGFSAWYELFPRSAAAEPGRHGTLRDVIARLPYVASMGFDVLYLPPIHPIGREFRKGPNNAAQSQPGDLGSPWAIGAAEGGHKAIHPELGTLQDFQELVSAAQQHQLEIALDIAFQCAPDHPYVRDHEQWFRKRPDGSIQYAENPPKKYQDIYPFDFESPAWQSLWEELKSIFVYWIEQGVRIFRVDNPHTKPFPFWEWVIGEIRRQWPDVLFLSEAFTRPKIMYRLAKLGFTQSYTYFSWRNTKLDLEQYVTELTRSEVREYFRPNFWPNTPDILTEFLQVGGRPAFMSRLVLAATLSPNYGIYGPPFEHGWSKPREPGSEEYLHSEKYEAHYHDLQRPDSLRDFIARVNRVRREHAALQNEGQVQFHPIENGQLLCYTRTTEDLSEILLIIVNLDPYHTQSGWVELPLVELGLGPAEAFQLHDLLSDARYLWQGARNFVELNPHVIPAHIFRVRRRVRTERDFEYYL